MKLKRAKHQSLCCIGSGILVAFFLAVTVLVGQGVAQPGDPVVIHISPAGADGNPGTSDKPFRSFDRLRQRLAEMPRVAEVVFHGGTYRDGLMLESLAGMDPAQAPLLLRAAEGEEVIFDGAGDLGNATPVARKPGVFALPYKQTGGEWPRLWESDSRVRYRLVADLAAVAHFPATYTVAEDTLYFHTSDGREPKAHQLGISRSDCGLFINRPYVTVRGLAFRNYLARGKWSCGIDLRTHHIVVEGCRAWNCSMGFTVTGDENKVLHCAVKDVGNGVYVGGKNARVEGCRLFKQRDAFMVPMYSQDDTAIQFYFPAGNGEVRNNLCVGFARGIFMKPAGDAYVVEHNTVICSHWGLSHTSWSEKCRYRYNIVMGSEEPVLTPSQVKPGTVDWNCYWLPVEPGSSAAKKLKDKTVGEHSIIADPRFVNPAAGDYRLAANSPCLKLKDDARPCGAFPAASADFKDTVPPEVERWVRESAVPSNAALGIFTMERKSSLPAEARPRQGDNAMGLGASPRTLYLAPGGLDTNPGNIEKPWKTLQHAADRARAGDTIILQPGIYDKPVVFTHGGTPGAPITIRATKKWEAILDGNRQANAMIHLRKAPFIEIHDVEIRWYESAGILLEHSTNVTVRGCKIWNDFWHNWPTGYAISASFSPHFTGEQNVLFRQESGFWLYNSPQARIVQNTCTANLYGAAHFLYSVRDSVCKNNDFAFQGNDVLVIEVLKGGKADLDTFECDYNNLGTMLREQPPGTVFDSVTPREAVLRGGSKAIIAYTEYGGGQLTRILSMKEWRAFSGKDQHSIFADPLHRSVVRHQFELDPKSPNLEAGEAGAIVGAFGPAETP